jgi:hypothetical protein
VNGTVFALTSAAATAIITIEPRRMPQVRVRNGCPTLSSSLENITNLGLRGSSDSLRSRYVGNPFNSIDPPALRTIRALPVAPPPLAMPQQEPLRVADPQ